MGNADMDAIQGRSILETSNKDLEERREIEINSGALSIQLRLLFDIFDAAEIWR